MSLLYAAGYRATLFVFVLFFLGSCSLLPIDTLIQSTKNDHSNGSLAVNAVVVIVCCVSFISLWLVSASLRFVSFYRQLSDIPKNYVPSHRNDFVYSQSYDHIQANLSRCQQIYHKSVLAPDIVEHNGLSSPTGSGLVVPTSLVYEDVIRALGQNVRFQDSALSFREVFLQAKNDSEARKMVAFYEKLRFSGKAVSQEDFLKFLTQFVKVSS